MEYNRYDNNITVSRITYSSFRNVLIHLQWTPKLLSFTMELKMNQRNKFSPHLPLNENPKLNFNGILPPFEAEG